MIETDQQAFATPVGFAEHLMKLQEYQWAKDILNEFLKPAPVRVAVAACNEAGKTTHVGVPLALWYASMHPNSLVIITAAVDRHIKQGFFHFLKQYAGLYDKKYSPTTEEWNLPNGSRIIGFCTNQAGKFEQWHNKNFLLIADEAKTIPDDIFMAFDRCRPTHQLLISSPGQKSGEFYKAFTNSKYGFKTFQIKASMCNHISPEKIRYIREKYSNRPSFVKSTLDGEFMDDMACFIMTRNMIEDCQRNKPNRKLGKRICFIDVGLGAAESTMAILDGNELFPIEFDIQEEQEKTANWFVGKIRYYKIEPANVYADYGVAGQGIVQNIEKLLGSQVHRINNEKPALDANGYVNRGAEMWWDAKYTIINKMIRLPEDDGVWVDQMTNRLIDEGRGGKSSIESKLDMATRGLESPDRADAICGVLSVFRWSHFALVNQPDYDPIQDAYNKLDTDYVKIGGGGDGGAY